MDDSRSRRKVCAELIDALERVLRAEFGLRSALDHARVLLGEDVRLAAAEQVNHARIARSNAIATGATLEAIGAAGDREREAERIAAQLESWRARARAEDALAVEVFVGARSLGAAADPRWRPGAALEREPLRPLYLREPALRICGHFEPDVDLLIHDRELGTLGMVQVLDAEEPEAIREQVSRYVDRATYLRHLLLTARDELDGRDRQIVSVELVLVHGADTCEGDGRFDVLYEVGEILRDLALETNCLHAIGINVLSAGAAGFSRAGLRRAFAWLLHDSRRWFAALEQRRAELGSSSAAARFGKLEAIELCEYRLPGQRTLALAPDARLHLLHGHNGSGKSSLVEALELMLTGSIERLAGIDDYERVVRNRWSDRPASVTLHPVELEVEPITFELHGGDRPAAPLAPGSRAASFRLDQTVMDRLARASDVDRAAELLAAFFADEAEVRERWQEAVARAEDTLARLPARIQTWLEDQRRDRQDLHEVVVERLAGLADGRIEAALFDALLPLPRALLRPLHPQIPALAELDERLERAGFLATDDPLLARIEAGFEAVAADLDARVATVEAVLRTLDRLARWWHEGDAVGFASEAAYAEALDEWLELTALVELAEQQLRVITILRGALVDGWDPRRVEQAGAAAGLLRQLASVEPEVVGDLERAREQWIERRDLLGRALRTSSERGGAGKPMAATRVRLDAREIAELDRFGQWWAPSETGPGLGQRIHAAIEGHEVRSFATAEIGAQAWVTPIIDAGRAMLAPLRTLKKSWRGSWREPIRQAVEDLDDLDDAPSEVAEEAIEAPAGGFIEAEIEAQGEDDGGWLELDDDADEDPRPTPGGGPPSEPAPLLRSAQPQSRSIPLSSGPQRGPSPKPAPPSKSRPSAKPSAPPPPSAPWELSPRPAAGPGPKPKLKPKPKRQPKREPEREPAPEPRSEAPQVERPPAELPVQEHGFPRPDAPGELDITATVERLRWAHEICVAAHEVGARVQDSFVARLAARDERALGLVDALNELMALFTPARWAYEDVVLRYEQDGEVSRLQFETGDVREAAGPSGAPPIRARADLRLNTAQLNAFTLALFLLCAPRVDNPIGLLVLDDPLQNMDELTVTTLARGLAKLLRVMPERWSLMMLFHGEGDLARFHDEVECGVYFLPWLSPTIRGRALTIGCRREDSRLGLTIQAIEELIGLRP